MLVVDQFGGKGNVLNFNVGDGVKFALPNVFWTRLQAKYGTVRYEWLFFFCVCVDPPKTDSLLDIFLCWPNRYLSFLKTGSILKTFYVRDNGIDLSIVNAIESITQCLRSEDGYCTSPPDEGVSLKSLGMS